MKFIWAASIIASGSLLASGAPGACSSETQAVPVDTPVEAAPVEDATEAPVEAPAPVSAPLLQEDTAYVVRVEETMDSLGSRLEAISAEVEQLAGER